MRFRTLVHTTLLVLAGCGDPGAPAGPPPLLSALPRELSSAEQRIAAGATAFGLDLMREVSAALPSDSNAVLSPVSASFALGMTLNGAGGETYDSMRAVLRLGRVPGVGRLIVGTVAGKPSAVVTQLAARS